MSLADIPESAALLQSASQVRHFAALVRHFAVMAQRTADPGAPCTDALTRRCCGHPPLLRL